MSDFLERLSNLSPKRLMLLALEQHDQLDALRRRDAEPVAVIGMGCRFPGGSDDPERFWTLLEAGRDAIVDIPADRWDADAWYDADPDAPGRIGVRQGGFLGRIGEFDAAFFGISAREAMSMDPQQRLLLEVAWEALERAGIAPDSLAGAPAGVFVGLCNADHFQRLLRRGPATIDTYVASGNAPSVAAGRIAYCLGLQGPAVTVDTACSSSLVALHLAVQSVRRGESRIALAGGVNVICAPETSIALTKGHMLAPDGRCKTFDAAADGFARGEGCGLLVLKRLSDAVADGDRVLALIRGSAVNQDGRSGGLTVPSGPAQEAVIRAALADAGIAPGDVDYVEAHGTGTSLGDPIEVRALARSIAAGRDPSHPLLIGSVKTNIGHLESAAGIAGVFKVVLSLQNGRIPSHLHYRRPNPHIDWSLAPVQVTADGRPWPRGERPRIAGVSSFGFSGTNAHVVIEEAPETPALDAGDAGGASRPWCLPLSAKSRPALQQLAARCADALDGPGAPAWAEVARTLGVGRARLEERAAVLTDEGRAVDALRALARGEDHPGLVTGRVEPGARPEVVFMFTGQGAQYPGMGAELYRHVPAFAEVVDRCDALLGADGRGRRLRSVLWPGEGDGAEAIHDTAWTQPALFALEVAMAAAWRAWGVEPAAVIGHSVGEYAAACVAGVFTLEDGLALIAERGRLMASVPPGGAMAAVFASADAVEPLLAAHGGRVSIAAYNAVDGVVLSGDAADIDALLATLARRDIRGHRLLVSIAAHSSRMDPVLDALQARANEVAARPPAIPVAWNVTGGQPLPGDGAPDGAYWRAHLRRPVRFAEGLASLWRDGYRCFLEVGPHPVLLALAQRDLPEGEAVLLASLRRGRPELAETQRAVAGLHVAGAPLDWRAVSGDVAAAPIVLPTYPFERKRFWRDPEAPGAATVPVARSAATSLLGDRLPTALPAWHRVLSADDPSWLGGHRVGGVPLVAAPVYVAAALEAARALYGDAAGAATIESLDIVDALRLGDGGRAVQLHASAPAPQGADGGVAFSIHSGPPSGTGPWQLNARGRIVVDGRGRLGSTGAEPTETLESCRARLDGPTAAAAHYRRLDALGIELRGCFRALRELWTGPGEALARIGLDDGPAPGADAAIHPALLDGGLQAIGAALPVAADGDALMLLASIGRVELGAGAWASEWAQVKIRAAEPDRPGTVIADLTLRDREGRITGSLDGVVLAAVAPATGDDRLEYRLEWVREDVVPGCAVHLPAPGRLRAPVDAALATLAERHGLDVYDTLLPALEREATGFAIAALRALGFDDAPGRTFDGHAEADRLRVQARHRRLFGRLLGMLGEDGLLSRASTTQAEPAGVVSWRVVDRLPVPSVGPAAMPAAIASDAPEGEARMLRRCGAALADVLRGDADPLGLLFPGGAMDDARDIYVDSPYARTFNGTLVEALRGALAAVPEASRVRVVEIGAGTGGTTGFVLPCLPEGRTDYAFTDVSPVFLAEAARRHARHGFVRHALLDIERDPAGQGFQAGGYDVAIAANVLHATADLGTSLAHARRLLADGGLLVLLEGVVPQRWVDLTFGLTEGWWRFEDRALRPDYPLLSRDAWPRALASAGFEDIEVFGGDGSAGRASQALIVARAAPTRRRWRVVGSDGLAAAIAARLAARGDRVERVAEEAVGSDPPSGTSLLDVAGCALSGIGPDAPAGPDASRDAVIAAQHRLARFAAARDDGRAWIVTRGAQPAAGRRAPGARWQAPLWGLGRVYALEQPDRWGALLDVDPDADDATAAEAVVAAVVSPGTEDQVAWRDGLRHVARLREAPQERGGAPALRADGTYLVTGAFGGLGPIVARWLVDRGARHLALMGRRADPASPLVRELEARGARVVPLAADVADEASLRDALARLASAAPPIRGVLHAAAAFAAAPIADDDEAALREALAAKLDGTANLLRLTADAPPETVVLFSSTTALLGAAGLGGYAAANAFMDACAGPGGDDSPRVLSVAWGTWEAMRLASDAAQRSYRDAGLLPMPAEEALAALERAWVRRDASHVVIASVDWPVLRALHEARRVRPLIGEVGRRGDGAAGARREADARREDRAAPARALHEALERCAAHERADHLVRVVRQEVADVLGAAEPIELGLSTGLFDLGMDSLMAVELRRRLERLTGLELPSTLTFNYPNVNALAGYLGPRLATALADGHLAAPASISVPDRGAEADPQASGPASGLPDTPEREAADLGALSDEELETRLLAALERTK